MIKTNAAIILALAISLVACKSGETINNILIGAAGPTHAIEVRDTEGQLLLTVDGIHGLKRPKNAGEVVIALWEADGTKYESAWFLPYFPETNKLSQGFLTYGTATNSAYSDGRWFQFETNQTSKELLRIQPIIATNWQSIGTYTPKTGASEDVQRGNIVTNTTAILEWKGKRHELLLESVNGPGCGERRVPNQNQRPQQWPLDGHGWSITNYYHMGTNVYSLAITNSVWIGMTNGITTNNILTDRW